MASYGIGIDTSCYTTSVAIIDTETMEIVDNFQKLLRVKKGEKGLRQSDAFFQHVQHLGDYFETCCKTFFENATYIAVSSKPRNREDSYMPVFTAGLNFAKTLANLLEVPLVETDHQSGHLAAAIYGLERPPGRFLALHLSGGTTEILACKIAIEHDVPFFDAEIIGGSLDISAGQLIDRIGVLLDFQFPCGRRMEEAVHGKSLKKEIKSLFPKIQKRPYFNISGGENKGQSLIAEEYAQEDIIMGLFDYIARQLIASIKILMDKGAYEAIVLSGGVAANDAITQQISKAFNVPVIRGEKRFCTDNGLGVATIPMIK